MYRGYSWSNGENTFHLAHIKNVRIEGRLRLCEAHGGIINATRLPMYNSVRCDFNEFFVLDHFTIACSIVCPARRSGLVLLAPI